MADIIAALIGGALSLLMIMFANVFLDEDNIAQNDYWICKNCKAGFCTEKPNSKECRRWRKENE